jgi:hypothetical protein
MLPIAVIGMPFVLTVTGIICWAIRGDVRRDDHGDRRLTTPDGSPRSGLSRPNALPERRIGEREFRVPVEVMDHMLRRRRAGAKLGLVQTETCHP